MPPPPAVPGLDRAALLAIRARRRDPEPVIARIRDHLAAHDGYVALSGGKDSLVTLHLALQADPNVPVAFFDSGLEFPETYAYLAQIAEQWNFRRQLHWITADPPLLQALEATGAWDHRRALSPALPDLHRILITEPSRAAHRACGPGELWGVRAAESRGRAALYANALRAESARACTGCCLPGPGRAGARRRRHGGVIRRGDGTVAYGPVWDWPAGDVWGYISRHGLPVNPVYAKLARLGAPEHCLRVTAMIDANGLEQGRAVWLQRGWPGLFHELALILPRLREFT
jgi:phosphoadenosine phosphosulfate reductase